MCAVLDSCGDNGATLVTHARWRKEQPGGQGFGSSPVEIPGVQHIK